jgi:tRNA modification GTPase
MDLTRAEAVAQAIEARSAAGLALAQSGLEGRLAERLNGYREVLETCGAELEVRLDYPGEEPGNWTDGEVVARLDQLAQDLEKLAESYRSGKTWVAGAKIVLVGRVNAGKSTLFNALLGVERALVSEERGTTRDIVEASAMIGSLAVTLFDTAGEREDAGAIEAAGIELRAGFIESADLVLQVFSAHLLHDASRVPSGNFHGARPVMVFNHIDRCSDRQVIERLAAAWRDQGQTVVLTNARAGEGLSSLREVLTEALAGEEPGEAALVIGSQRQRDLLGRAAGHARAAAKAIDSVAGIAVAAEDVCYALDALAELDGRETREGVLDRLFARFCIGK